LSCRRQLSITTYGFALVLGSIGHTNVRSGAG
jgi:hypothetical protein